MEGRKEREEEGGRKEGRKGEDVAQLVERRAGVSLTQVRFPDAARDFSPRVNFQCRVQPHVLTSVRTLKIL